MEEGTLTRAFIMEVNGKFVVNPPKSVEDDNDRIPTRLGPRTDAAVLKLTDGYLSSGEYYMGRWAIEPRALMPMQVFWAKEQGMVQACQRDGPEEDPQLKTNGVLLHGPCLYRFGHQY
ncbi:hypothetical protein CUC08_Gglean008873 [Alternaria sp. MG1]|nr:hypothetical protein CUC08_Gglean008873 [Alternaria sp. MG1]